MDLRIVYNFKPKYCDDELREMETIAISEKETCPTVLPTSRFNVGLFTRVQGMTAPGSRRVQLFQTRLN